MVRVAAEQLPDTVRLPVREAESAMERLFRDLHEAIQCMQVSGRPPVSLSMGSEDERQLPFVCECGDVGCERCVPATPQEFAEDLLFAPGHEPAPAPSVADVDR